MIKQNAIVHLYTWKKGVYIHIYATVLVTKKEGCKCFDCQHKTSIIHPKLIVSISDVILSSYNCSIKD